MTICVDEDMLGADIAVNNAARVECGDGVDLQMLRV